MESKKKNTLSWLSDRCFEFFYIMLFLLQIPPAVFITFFGLSYVGTWIACAIGLIAMIVQAVKFPCFQNMVWRAGVCASVILSAIYSAHGDELIWKISEMAGKIVGA